VLAATLAALSVTAVAGAPSDAGRYRSTTTRIGPGVRFTRIVDPTGPWRIKVVTVNLSRSSTIDVALGTDVLPGFERTSSMAIRHRAVAAINGDYARPSGRPVFAFMEDGLLAQTPLKFGRNFAVNSSETVGYMGHPNVTAWLYESDSGIQYDVARVNQGQPSHDELALFTPHGASEEQPPQLACSARLYATEPVRFSSPGPGVESTYQVDAVRCGDRRLGRRGGVVVSAPIGGAYDPTIRALLPAEQVVLGWSFGWFEIKDALGGNPTLIENGQIIERNVSGSERFFRRHPRTGVGLRPDGRVLMVTVDGRRDRSVGMTLREFADLFSSLGATWALNLDGGGSTTMVVDGDVKNRPSDGSERAVSSALLVLRGSDSGEAVPVEGPVPTPDSDPAWEAAVADPASTGGLAAVLTARGARSAWLLDAARAFRGR
jgi:hypothetical protein